MNEENKRESEKILNQTTVKLGKFMNWFLSLTTTEASEFLDMWIEKRGDER